MYDSNAMSHLLREKWPTFMKFWRKMVLDFYMTSILVILIDPARLWTIPKQMPLFSRFHDRYYNRKSISAEARFSGMSHQ